MSVGSLDYYSTSVSWEVAFETLACVVFCSVLFFFAPGIRRARALCQFAYNSCAMCTQLGAGHGVIINTFPSVIPYFLIVGLFSCCSV